MALGRLDPLPVLQVLQWVEKHVADETNASLTTFSGNNTQNHPPTCCTLITFSYTTYLNAKSPCTAAPERVGKI